MSEACETEIVEHPFDRMTRAFGGATTRRAAMAAAVAGLAMAAGLRAADAAEVTTEDQKCEDRPCDKDKDCGSGLICVNEQCKYESGGKGQKGDTCCKNKECKDGFDCINRKCGVKADDKCKGKSCVEDKECGQGLVCGNNDKCEYKHGSKGKKGDTCCGNKECKKKLECRNKRCNDKN